ncbi:hypothetical protein SeMB42_g06374 [Synchytrium endobioticum]|uniref:Uncharacterized protein n=1 Tax=Synchytrium endobioticum TaxID=286115 RepID=A0A507CIS1_9FUNG|nr:hypothetical protein SeMB42_g06374 [Synchytrium endobioticum]
MALFVCAEIQSGGQARYVCDINVTSIQGLKSQHVTIHVKSTASDVRHGQISGKYQSINHDRSHIDKFLYHVSLTGVAVPITQNRDLAGNTYVGILSDTSLSTSNRNA